MLCERADLLALVCRVYVSLSLSHWDPGSGVVCLIVSIPDLCTNIYFHQILISEIFEMS